MAVTEGVIEKLDLKATDILVVEVKGGAEMQRRVGKNLERFLRGTPCEKVPVLVIDENVSLKIARDPAGLVVTHAQEMKVDETDPA